MSRPVCFVGPWDLDRRLAAFPRDPADATILFVESVAKGSALPYHRQKLVLVLSALHHLAAALRADGFDVEVRRAPTYVDGIRAHVAERGSTEVIAMTPREWGLDRALREADLGAPLRLLADGGPGGHFLVSREDALAWAQDHGLPLRQDAFYRWIRTRFGWMLDDRGKPVGGRWSFDADNRKPARGHAPPPAMSHAPDDLTRGIIDRVACWPDHWGSVDGFQWPVTREGALAELDHFIEHRLPTFGDFQDAMLDGEPWMWHARLSTSLNLGLLHPREVADRVVAAWEAGHAPIHCAEGMLRQVVGWREFMRLVYWLRMPGLREANGLDADRPLPAMFWHPERATMRCVQQAVQTVHDHGYAHHIQRLMVLGNLALLLGVRPLDISHWFWAGFVDAYEWVELPNVHGMAVFADDAFTTKPYAASGAYIHRMGDHCRHCRFDVKQGHGDDACPFNPLFWDFMARHRDRLARNVRLRRLYATWDRFDPARQDAIRATAAAWRDRLGPSEVATRWSFDDDAC